KWPVPVPVRELGLGLELEVQELEVPVVLMVLGVLGVPVVQMVPEVELAAVLEVELAAVLEVEAEVLEVPVTPARPVVPEVLVALEMLAMPEIQQANYSHWAVQLQAADYSVGRWSKTAGAISAVALEPIFEWPVSARTSAAESDGSA
ncbi:hypothetical protein IW139_003885, partial [Coemansia sp. RSA 353]